MVDAGFDRNQLLAALPREVAQRWAAHLEPVEMDLGEVVYEPGEPLRHVLFPTTALVSLLHVLHDGAMAESADRLLVAWACSGLTDCCRSGLRRWCRRPISLLLP